MPVYNLAPNEVPRMTWTIPNGFELLPSPRVPGVMLFVASRAREALLRAGIDRPEEAAERAVDWVGGGRSRHPVIEAGGERWILKAYRRGGLLARLNPLLYWRVGRFFEEIAITLAAIRARVPAPEPIALVLRRAGLSGAHRAWQVVNHIPGVASLRELLLAAASGQSSGRAEMRVRFRAAGEAVRRMHDAHIDHPDLNLGNVLTRAAAEPPSSGSRTGPPAGPRAGPRAAPCEAFIVDWDRARMRLSPRWNPNRNLLRLWRSALKLARSRPDVRTADPAPLQAFLRGYFGRNRAGLHALRRYARLRGGFLLFHRALWSFSRKSGVA